MKGKLSLKLLVALATRLEGLTYKEISTLTAYHINTVSRYVTLKRDSVSGTTIAKKGFLTFADITDWTEAAGDTANEVSFVSFTIDASNGTGFVDVYVLADTNNAAAAKNISTTIGSGSNVVTWSDGISSNITSLDDKPIAGGSVSY